MRGFEYVKEECRQNSILPMLPKRSTKSSAGYDFFSPVDVVIPAGKMFLIFSDIKAKMQPDEVLLTFARSSMGKIPLVISNGTGIIDSDYYGNIDNDGNIGFRLHNLGESDHHVHVGDKIAQGVFIKYLTIGDSEKHIRKGGFGSNDKK